MNLLNLAGQYLQHTLLNHNKLISQCRGIPRLHAIESHISVDEAVEYEIPEFMSACNWENNVLVEHDIEDMLGTGCGDYVEDFEFKFMPSGAVGRNEPEPFE